MASYEVIVDWNATSHVVVEADSEDAAELDVQNRLDKGYLRPSASEFDLYDPEVVIGLTDLVSEPHDPALD